MQDCFQGCYEWCVAWAGGIPEGKLVAVVRLALLLTLPATIYWWAFVCRKRESFVRLAASIAADGLVLAMPLRVPEQPAAKAWILVGCLLLLAYLPGAIPFAVCREAGRQRRLGIVLYAATALLLIVGVTCS